MSREIKNAILEEIQIIGINKDTINASNNYITLNGEFEFNIGDEVTIITTNNTEPNRYKVISSDNSVADKIVDVGLSSFIVKFERLSLL